MSVNQPCKTYTAFSGKWSKIRDAISGEDAIKKGRELYLPRPSGMDDDEYAVYITRPHWFGAARRTHQGLHGMIFSKKPILSDCPDALESILNDIDLEGTGIDQFASDLINDTLQTNFSGILVDYQTADPGLDVATAERLGYRTYAEWYSAESIINWQYKTINNKRVLSLVVLVEPYEKKNNTDEFAVEIKHRYRVLDFDEEGRYRQRIYDDDSSVGLTVPILDFNPKKQGKYISYLPFFLLPGKNPEDPMLYDLVCENIGHYQKTADYENGLHLTGIPTPYSTGAQPIDMITAKPIPVKMGANTFLFLNDPSATAGFLEFTGQGLATLEKALQNCEERMAILGARIISAEKKGVESASSARIHRAGENSVLASFAMNISDVLTLVIREIAEWENISGYENTTYELTTDYDVSEMESQQFAALTTARLSKEIGRKVYFYNLKKGEYIPDDMDLTEFEEDISEDGENNNGPTGDDQNAQIDPA
jgi:hypothetical protein